MNPGDKVTLYEDYREETKVLGKAILIKKLRGIFSGVEFQEDECEFQRKHVFINKENHQFWELTDKQIRKYLKVIERGEKGIEMLVEREMCNFYVLERWECELDGKIVHWYKKINTGIKPLHINPDLI